jgi:peptidoglycan hydrolase-like protein with peptidoglycan-binding domain
MRSALVGAALAAALVGATAAEAAPQKTKLTLSGPHKAAPGQTITLTAILTAAKKPLPGKAVSLFTGPTAAATVATDASGKARFSLQIAARAKYQARFAPAPPDAPALTPATSKTLDIRLASALTGAIQTFLHAAGRAVAVPHAAVKIRGTVAPFVPGQQVTIDVFEGNKRIKHKLRPVRTGSQGKGVYSLSYKPAGRGAYLIRASTTSASKRAHLYVVRASAHGGSRGLAVRALQNRLAELGYMTPVNGFFNSSTSRAVLAFRKVNGMARTTSANGAVFRKLARGRGGFRVRFPSAGKHVEFDWSRQVLVLTQGATPQRIVPASSGKPSTPTVFGKFHFYSKTPGFNSHGMYFSNYFIGGYAIHGYAEVPDYAASHGCIRIPIPSAIAVYKWISLGDPIYVYR